MKPPRDLVWATLLGAGIVYEVYELKAGSGGTLSEVTRRVLRADTPVGGMVFTAGWLAFALWFADHITAAPATQTLQIP